jgi:hypothetical protein
VDLQHFMAVAVAVEKEMPQPERPVRVDPVAVELVEKSQMGRTELQIRAEAEAEQAVNSLVGQAVQGL